MIEMPDLALGVLLPELVLALGATIILLLEGRRRPSATSTIRPLPTGATRPLSTGPAPFGASDASIPWMAALIVTALAGVAMALGSTSTRPVGAGMLMIDGFTQFIRAVVLLAIASVLLMSKDYARRFRLNTGEFYALILFSGLGALLMAAADDLLVVFLGLEVHSIALYVLAGYRRDRPAEESCLKYLLLGAFASAFLLYGIALVYGATSTTNLHDLALVLRLGDERSLLLYAGMGLLIVGLGFKIAAVPFHMWTPDVYEGAPSVITAFMAVVPKAGAIAALLRVFETGLLPLAGDWRELWAGLAILTMTVGNVLAVVQRNLKRLLAYSSIAHAGYLLVGLAAGDALGASGILFYLVAYALMNLGAFAVVAILERGGRGVMVDDYAGLATERPLLAAALVLFMFSLAGVPPTAGFMGKFYLFGAAVQADMTGLAIIAVLNSVVGVAYYLRVVVAVVLKDPDLDWTRGARATPAPVAAVLAAAIGTLQMGLFPGLLYRLATAGARALY
jgi:NADH-quinone oxidoreductase subunit N